MTRMGQEKMSIHLSPTADQVTIGIDISKDHLEVYVHPEGSRRQFPNDRAGHAALIVWISPRQPTRVVFEATGAYHRGLQKALAKAGLPGVKLNPLQARRFAEAIGRRAKTDPVDAAPDIASNVLCWPASALPSNPRSGPRRTLPSTA